MVPLPTHIMGPVSQQAPPVHVLPAQQALPAAPHIVHVSCALQEYPVPAHVRPGQHG
jgi:hypothetical protein